MTPLEYVANAFGTFDVLVKLQAAARPDHPAIVTGDASITYRRLDDRADRIAAGLQRDGVGRGGVVAICASASIEYLAVFLGVLRSGAAVSPLSPSATPSQLADMISDSGAVALFADEAVLNHLATAGRDLAIRVVALEGGGGNAISAWVPTESARPSAVSRHPEDPFNIIYSSGTTGVPKGIVQSHAMRWPHVVRADPPGYGPDAVTMISTPLYSNTTLVSVIPTLAGGGTLVLMSKFDTKRFLELAQSYRATHAMLVPVQFRRLLDDPDFDAFDLSSFVVKFATSAPFSASLKAEVLARWPGGLVEFYGMTEGGGSCMLIAHEHPDKLATVGQPMEGHDIRVIDEAGEEAPTGSVGEIVGFSPAIMSGYHNRPDQSRQASWRSPDGRMFIRTGDVGRFDDEGFLTLLDRRKEMIISGGSNIYPSDLEAVLLEHPAVAEAAVIGTPSREWGETPVGFVVLSPGAVDRPEEVKDWANDRLGKMQRLSSVYQLDELPRLEIGKVEKPKLLALVRE